MSTPLEHDYIGLSEIEKNTSSTVSTEENEKKKKNNVLNHKETELRLGLPGSESPERITGGTGVSFLGKVSEDKNGAYPLGLLKNFVPSGKRGFSDAIDVSGKWVFSGNGGSDVDLGKGSVLFSPRGGNGGKPLGGAENSTQQSCSAATLMNDVVPQNPNLSQEKKPQISATNDQAPPAKSQVVGWPPIRSFRKNTLATNPAKKKDDTEVKSECLYVKVSMDGAPYLRKVDLKTYTNYVELSSALRKMFSCFTIDLQQNSGQCNYNGIPGRDGLSESRLRDLLHGSDCVLTYEDKDGDWMLVGDVPWDMFTDSCKRLRIMKGSEAIGLAPRTMEKSKNKN